MAVSGTKNFLKQVQILTYLLLTFSFLQLFNNVIFKKFSASTNRNDGTLYSIISYLTFFRLDELAIEDYKKLILSQDAVKMNVLLQFMFNTDNLRDHVREEWMTLYDYTYIDEKIIGGIEKNMPRVSEILKKVELRATGKTTSYSQSSMSEGGKLGETGQEDMELTQESKLPKKVTEQQPFNLTKPKPKVIPQPEPIKKEVKANPVPKNIFKKSLAEIEQEKEERRKAKTEAIKESYDKDDKKRFQFQAEKRPQEKFEKKKEDYIKQKEKELKFNMKHAREMPDFEKKEAQVKLTTAAVVREGHLLKKKEEQELKKLKEYEMSLRDEREFERWRTEMKEKDEVERLEHIQKKKIEMELAREEAIQAQKRKEKENQLLVQQIKTLADIRLQQLEEEKQELFEKKKEIVEAVQSQKDNALREMEKVKEEKKKIRDEVNRELTEAMQRKKEEDAIEQRKREELIRQIRELEKIPIVRTKGFDPTETGGYGLLEEMSLAELRERLEFNKLQREQEIAFKREENLKEKEDKAKNLMDEASKIYEAREKRKQENDEKKIKKQIEKEQKEAKLKAAREKGLLEVHEKINKKKQDKKAEEDKLAKELKEIKLQRQYLNANKAMVEEKAWKELEAGAERQIRNAQNQKLLDQCALNGIKVKDETIRATNARTVVEKKLETDRKYHEKLTTVKKENEVLHKKTLQYKTDMHERQREFEDQQKINNVKRNPFNAKINQQSLANATKKKQSALGNTGEGTYMDIPDGGMGGFNDNVDLLHDDMGGADDIDNKIEMEQ